MESAIFEGVTNVVSKVAGVKPGENVLIIHQNGIDDSVVNAFADVAQDVGAQTAVIRCKAQRRGEPLPRMVASALIGADIVIDLFNVHTDFSNTQAVWRAIFEYGVRMLHIDPPHMAVLKSNAAKIHPSLISKIATILKERVTHGSTIHITTKSGTEFTCKFDIKRASAPYRFPLEFGSTPIPLGVFTLPPARGTCEGSVAFDAVDGFPGPVETPLRFVVKQSVVTEVEGGLEAEFFLNAFTEEKDANYLSELGIGINPFVPFRAFVVERWHESINRKAGLVHMGIGGTYWEGGPKSFHSHQVIFEPTVEIAETGEVIVEEGNLKILEEIQVER